MKFNMGFIARALSKRIRELEQKNEDLAALIDKDFEKISITKMNFDEKTGFEATIKTGVGGIIAAWAYNALEDCGAKNYLELGFYHPKGGNLIITIQKVRGETPAQVAKRLESELNTLRLKQEEVKNADKQT